MNEKEVANSVKDIKQMTKDWKGDEVKDLSLSVGYALLADHKDYSCNDLLKEADRKMYKAKDEFYRKSGMNRRKI
jgi:GGDEF domain-containing protein